MRPRHVYVTDGRTDRGTDNLRCQYRALHMHALFRYCDRAIQSTVLIKSEPLEHRQ